MQVCKQIAYYLPTASFRSFAPFHLATKWAWEIQSQARQVIAIVDMELEFPL